MRVAVASNSQRRMRYGTCSSLQYLNIFDANCLHTRPKMNTIIFAVIQGSRITRGRTNPWILLATPVPRPGPDHVYPDAFRERLANGIHVPAGFRASAALVVASAVGGESDLWLCAGFLVAALRAKVVSIRCVILLGMYPLASTLSAAVFDSFVTLCTCSRKTFIFNCALRLFDA